MPRAARASPVQSSPSFPLAEEGSCPQRGAPSGLGEEEVADVSCVAAVGRGDLPDVSRPQDAAEAGRVQGTVLLRRPRGRERGLASVGWFHAELRDKGELQNILPVKLFGDCLVYLLTKISRA